jgi:hypothetical protein
LGIRGLRATETNGRLSRLRGRDQPI